MADVRIIKLPNTLADRIGPRARVFTAALVQRAEQALAQISRKFGSWLQDDVNRLDLLIDGTRIPLGADGLARIQSCVRQLESSGAAFGYPVISRLAVSLGGLFADGAHPAPPDLIAAHLDAIKAAARDQRGREDDPVALATCVELEALAGAFLRR